MVFLGVFQWRLLGIYLGLLDFRVKVVFSYICVALPNRTAIDVGCDIVRDLIVIILI
jgi:hypothetical protein